jgi:hypothetical protein
LTITDGTYPVSNGLYGRFGMYPWLVLSPLAGTLSAQKVVVDQELADATRRLNDDPADLAAVAQIDQRVLGIRRDADHEQWLTQPDMVGYLFGEPSRPEGYAYFSTPGRSYVPTAGAIGPVATAARQGSFSVNALRFCLARMQELGVQDVRVKLPGMCRESIGYLLALGLRLQRPQLFLASEPFAQADGYIPSGSDALF